MPVKSVREAKSVREEARFVIHEHFAKRHHFDLRLEMDGVLKSWAIPKEIPVVPGEKRLAVEVEDHPVEYADFEGIIPEGEYGAGKVLVWDSGHYQLLKRDPKRIEFAVKGKKISGIYGLVLFRKERNNNWLFFQKHEKD